MMKINLFIFIAILLVSSCSSKQQKNSVSISTASTGLLKNHELTFPLYLTNKIESRDEIVKKTSPNVFIIQTGHILKANATKDQNMAVLDSLAGKGIDVVNLSIEDFIIADAQDILFENYPQKFLNSSVVDLNEDNIISKPNIVPFIIHDGVALIGLSDQTIDDSLKMDKFLVSDYVLAVLRAKKAALQHAPAKSVSSFIIIHTLGSEINEVMERLPPSFINSLAD